MANGNDFAAQRNDFLGRGKIALEEEKVRLREILGHYPGLEAEMRILALDILETDPEQAGAFLDHIQQKRNRLSEIRPKK